MIFFYSCILGFFLWYEEICFVLGEYVQNLCPANSPSCVSCPKRLPSCVGLPGTQEGFPGKLWQADYIVCDTNRTMNISQCPSGEYFNPRLKKCMKKVPNGRFRLLKGRCKMMHCRCKRKSKTKCLNILWNIVLYFSGCLGLLLSTSESSSTEGRQLWSILQLFR